jgi:tRNA U55 pseudouridine synthase TruB
VGPFSIETALSLEQLEGSPVETGLQPPLAAVAHLPRWMMSDGEVANIILGRSIACPDELTDSDHVALTNSQGLLVSIARVQTGADEVRLQPKRVLAS